MEIKILDFTGKWCSSCIVLDKMMESEIIPKYKNKVKFIKIDIEEGENLIKQYKILSVPTLILLKNNKEIWRKSSSITKDEVIKELNKALK
ncbi:MAG: thioredoxin family protein [Candidatus Pacearchaeota archaeon]